MDELELRQYVLDKAAYMEPSNHRAAIRVAEDLLAWLITGSHHGPGVTLLQIPISNDGINDLQQGIGFDILAALSEHIRAFTHVVALPDQRIEFRVADPKQEQNRVVFEILAENKELPKAKAAKEDTLTKNQKQ